MEKLLRIRRRHRSSVLAATVVALLAGVLAIPALASAANTLSLRIKPAVPKEGTPFQIIATGTSGKPNPEADSNILSFGFGPGRSACASTAFLENRRRQPLLARRVLDGPFDVFHTFRGGRLLPEIDGGLVTGRYRVCGYVYRARFAGERCGGLCELPLAADRLEFTVGGTCDSATAKQANVQKQKNRAQKQLMRSKRSGTGRQVKKAQKKLRKTKARLKMANEDRKALC